MSGAANGRPVLGISHTVNKHASLFAGIDTDEEKRFRILMASYYLHVLRQV